MKIRISGPDDDRLFWLEIKSANGLSSAWSARVDNSIGGRTLGACKVELAGSVELAAVYPSLEIDIVGAGTVTAQADLSFQEGLVADLRTASAMLSPRACPGAMEIRTAIACIDRVIAALAPTEDPAMDTEASPHPTSTPQATPGCTG